MGVVIGGVSLHAVGGGGGGGGTTSKTLLRLYCRCICTHTNHWFMCVVLFACCCSGWLLGMLYYSVMCRFRLGWYHVILEAYAVLLVHTHCD